MVVDATMLATGQQQAMFFRNPTDNPVIPGTFGTLYLLRRDLNDMREFMRDPNKKCERVDLALWPRAMVIFAGIDLIAKFYANDDATGGGAIGQRFRDFVARFITQDNDANSAQTQAVWQCRNSVLHSFGWYSESGGVVYRFSLTRTTQNWLMQQDPNNAERWWLNLTRLEQRFDASIGEYEALINDPNEPETFPTGNQIFEKYGWMNIG